MTETFKAHKMARVLSGNPLKYTCLIVKKSGQVFEFQSDTIPTIKYNEQTRTVLLCYGQYDANPICSWDDVDAIFHEPNPADKESAK